MINYHVSGNHYRQGTIVSTNNYFKTTQERGNEWIERLLIQHKPVHAPSRLNCVFTFPDMEQTLAYGTTLAYPVHYYQVEVSDDSIRCPMVLCDFIRKSSGRKPAILESLCSEYWNPTLDWQFYEFLSPEFMIIEHLETPDHKLTGMGRARYEGDKCRANSFVENCKKNHTRIKE